MSMSPEKGIAILGAGIFAIEAHLPALAALGDAAPTLTAVYSRSEKSAHTLASAAVVTLRLTAPPAIYHDQDPSTSLDILLARSDISAVIIVLPITVQPSIILKSLNAGKHVLSEKPIAPDVDQGLALIKEYQSIYRENGLIWRVAENFEAEPGYRAAGAAIAAGKIGKVLFFRTTVVNYIDKESKWYKTPWRTVPDYQGGFLLDGGVHTIAALRTMLHERLTHLSGFASLNKDYLKPHDTIHVVARAGSHFHGTLELTWASPTKSQPVSDGFTVTGSDGWLSINQITVPTSQVPILRVKIIKVNDLGEESEEIIDEPLKGVQSELSSFFKAIVGKDHDSDLGNPVGALQDVAFIQAALNSNGNLVDLFQLVPV